MNFIILYSPSPKALNSEKLIFMYCLYNFFLLNLKKGAVKMFSFFSSSLWSHASWVLRRLKRIPTWLIKNILDNYFYSFNFYDQRSGLHSYRILVYFLFLFCSFNPGSVTHFKNWPVLHNEASPSRGKCSELHSNWMESYFIPKLKLITNLFPEKVVQVQHLKRS